MTTTAALERAAPKAKSRGPRGLGRYTITRIGAALLTLLGLSILVFALVQLLPGDLGRSILGQYATNEQVQQLNESLGVNRPFATRYLDWLGGFLTGDWGTSQRLGLPAREAIVERLSNSLILAVATLIIVVPVAVGAGLYAAIRRGKFADRAISIAGVSLMAIPEFVSGVLLLVIFGVYLQWFPVQSRVPSWDPLDIVRQLTLPVIPLCFILFGYVARMMRATAIDVLETNYVRTAFLKGLSFRQIMRRHVVRNAILPTITVIAGQAGYLIGGLVIVETLFSYPGIGNFAYESAKYHDVAPLTDCVVIIGAVVLIFNLIGDITTASLNPRLSKGGN